MSHEGVTYMARLVYDDGSKYWHGQDGSDWYALMQAEEALSRDKEATHAEIVKITTVHEKIGVRSRGMGEIKMPTTVDEHDRIMSEGMEKA